MNLKRWLVSALAVLLIVLECISCTATVDQEGTSIDEKCVSVKVPILMYHHIAEEGNGDTIISIEGFEKQLNALSDAGYTTIFYDDLISYVEKGTSLPDKPILLTFDDGYESNLSIAAPILEKYGMCATIAIVGVTEGASFYKDTGVAIFPHFSLEDNRVKTLMEQGVIDIQMHTYDMHQVESLDGEGCRIGAVIMDGETEEDYTNTLKDDYAKIYDRILKTTGRSPVAYTYPHGKYDALSESIIHSLGAKVTVTTDVGVSEIVKDDPSSLYLLKRYNITDDFAGKDLVDMIEKSKYTGTTINSKFTVLS